MKVISKKANKAIWGNVLITFLLLILFGVCVWRATEKHALTIMIIVIGLAIVSVYWIVKEVINLIKSIKRPQDLILVDEENKLVKFYYLKKYETLKFDEIKEVLAGSYQSKNWFFFSQSVVFRTENKSYAVVQIEDADKALNSLEIYLPTKIVRTVEKQDIKLNESYKKIDVANKNTLDAEDNIKEAEANIVEAENNVSEAADEATDANETKEE